MTISAMAGPLVIYGQNPPQAGTAYQPDYNPDIGPSSVSGGLMVIDPRFGFRSPLQAGSLATVGFVSAVTLPLIDQVPSVLATANIAALANVTSGTAMTLVATTGAGITVSAAALTFPVTGVTLPIGTRFIDSLPAFLSYGQGSIQSVDIRTMIGRAVSITGVSGGSGGAFLVRGYDVYGVPMTESITVGAGATTQNGTRGFKAITSVTPQFTNAFNYSVGTADIYEFPIMVTQFAQLTIFWNNAAITTNTGLVLATTTTATATSGSERGTYAVQSASDGTKRLQITVNPAPYNQLAANGAASLFGPTRYTA